MASKSTAFVVSVRVLTICTFALAQWHRGLRLKMTAVATSGHHGSGRTSRTSSSLHLQRENREAQQGSAKASAGTSVAAPRFRGRSPRRNTSSPWPQAPRPPPQAARPYDFATPIPVIARQQDGPVAPVTFHSGAGSLSPCVGRAGQGKPRTELKLRTFWMVFGSIPSTEPAIPTRRSASLGSMVTPRAARRSSWRRPRSRPCALRSCALRRSG